MIIAAMDVSGDGHGSVMETDPDGPEAAHLLEVQGCNVVTVRSLREALTLNGGEKSHSYPTRFPAKAAVKRKENYVFHYTM